MHVLITGGTSLLGIHIVRILKDADIRVTVTYRTPGSRLNQLEEILKKSEIIQIDLNDTHAFTSFPKDLNVIVHLAATLPASGVAVEKLVLDNVMGTHRLINYALGAKVDRMIYASSLLVHGTVTVPVVDENTMIVNPGDYGMTKYLGERLLADVAKRIPSVAMRLPGVLGPGAHNAWLPNMFNLIKLGKDVTIYNPDSQFNNAIHGEDVGRFVVNLVNRDWIGYHVMPLATSGLITVRSAANRLIERIGSHSSIHIQQSRKASFIVSSEFAVRKFGYRPTDIEKVLDQYADENR